MKKHDYALIFISIFDKRQNCSQTSYFTACTSYVRLLFHCDVRHAAAASLIIMDASEVTTEGGIEMRLLLLLLLCT